MTGDEFTECIITVFRERDGLADKVSALRVQRDQLRAEREVLLGSLRTIRASIPPITDHIEERGCGTCRSFSQEVDQSSVRPPASEANTATETPTRHKR